MAKQLFGLFVSKEEPIFTDTYSKSDDFIPGMLVYDFLSNTYSTDGETFLTPQKANNELHKLAIRKLRKSD